MTYLAFKVIHVFGVMLFLGNIIVTGVWKVLAERTGDPRTIGIIWVAILIPTQIAQAREARGFAEGGVIPDSYWRLSRRWAIWGTIATLLPLANLYFMVVKPA